MKLEKKKILDKGEALIRIMEGAKRKQKAKACDVEKGDTLIEDTDYESDEEAEDEAAIASPWDKAGT